MAVSVSKGLLTRHETDGTVSARVTVAAAQIERARKSRD
jgi:hypothetical protein